ncbi:hypothetical protein HOLleu_25414 [Holothuria leucospilota]|uniref:Uncharacterized protein n=1 Tax=Holothuria leucospilota TaxID=206669 RepID=A0A9Q1BST7_HOLLE|nr:hypothetical protein HOLleu_25414 [Holothuria leucospilota]
MCNVVRNTIGIQKNGIYSKAFKMGTFYGDCILWEELDEKDFRGFAFDMGRLFEVFDEVLHKEIEVEDLI